MANTAYYVYAADGDHGFLGRLSISKRISENVDALIGEAKKKFKVTNIRIESKPRQFRPQLGRIKVQPMVARISQTA